MLKQGLFVDKSGEEHLIYIVDEPQFFRLDITRVGANFHTDLDMIEFSLVRKRKTYIYGDRRLYSMYNEIFDRAHEINVEGTKESHWEHGEYITVTTKQKEGIGFAQESKMINGIFNMETIVFPDENITIYVEKQVYGVKLDPVNFAEYTEIELMSKSEVTFSTPYIPLKILKQRYDIAHIDDNDCCVADTLDLARERLKHWVELSSPVKGFDTETTGTDINMYGEDNLVGIILAEDEHTSTYFPFRHKEGSGTDNLPMEFLTELMKEVINQQDRLVAHNKKFDRETMMFEGYDLRIHWCSLLLSMILEPTFRVSHGLKDLIYKMDGLVYLELSDIFVSSKQIDFSVLPKDIVKYYACPDGYNVIRVFNRLMKKLPIFQQLLFEKECQLADLIADQEYYGMRVDIPKYVDSYNNCNYVLDVLLKTFMNMTHVDGNINSNEVLRDLLYNKMRCKVVLRTNTGRASTSSAVIRKLASMSSDKPRDDIPDLLDMHGNVVISGSKLGKSKYPALMILDKYKEYNKRKTAFYARFERTMKTGRIFFWVNQYGAESGRQSSPMHQLPPELKAVMLSDLPNRKFWGPDYSQIEIRMIAFLAGETDLINLCEDPDNDIHRAIGSLINDCEMWEITNEMRQQDKRRNFGAIYLISGYGLAKQMFGPGYTKEQAEWCSQKLDELFKRFKRINRYVKQNRERVLSKGYMMTTGYNRIRYFNEIFDPDISKKLKASLIRQANNMPVQGTAADLMKISLVNMYYYIREKGWYEKEQGIPLVRPMLSIHDEILISSHESIPYEEIIEMIKVCMEVPIEGAPPFFVQPAMMDNWEGHSDDSLAIPIRYRDELIDNYHSTGKTVFKKSQYKLIIGESVKEELMKRKNEPLHVLLKEFDNKVSWEYIKGDYGTEITDEGRKHGLQSYIESEMTCVWDENYKRLLAEYRNNVLSNYMDGLIAEYGTDYKVVSMHVRHPSLTHELLARFKEELKAVKHLDLSHVEQIEYATKCYIEGIKSEEVEEETIKTIADKDAFIDSTANLVNFDSNGNVIYDDPDDAEDEAHAADDDDENYIDYITAGKTYHVWELADIITVDVDSLNKEAINKVIAHIWQYKDDNGFYKVYLLYGNKLLDTNFRVENIDIEEVSNFIEEVRK